MKGGDGRRVANFILGPVTIALALLVQLWRFPSFWTYAVPDLPAFDAYVYVAAAEHPRIFTVAPWGQRPLVPWLAAALPGQDLTTAFKAITLASVALGALLLWGLLRRRGHPAWVAAIGAAVFVLSPPIGELIAAPFLVDPLAVALLTALLLALEVRAPLAVLAVLAVLGALAKEVLVPFLPVVFFARRGDRATRLRDAAVVLVVATASLLVLRLAWTPGVLMVVPHLDAERASVLAGSLRAHAGLWLRWAAVGGLTPFALLGAFRPGGRDVLARYGFVLAVAVLQPVFAPDAIEQVVGEFNRYLAYAVPVLVLLAGSVGPRATGVDAPAPLPRWTAPVSAALTLLLVAGPPLFVDRYRRLDLRGRRDGLYVLGFCRQTVEVARRLVRGRAVWLRVSERRFARHGFETSLFERMRWFLWEGWGPSAHYGTAEVFMAADRAILVVPVADPAALQLTLALSAAAPTEVSVAINDRELGRAALGTSRERFRFTLPRDALFRGDNLLRLEVAPGTARARLYAVAASPLEVP